MNAGRHSLMGGETAADDSLALVNDGNAYIETDFLLGGTKMQMEAVLLRRSTDNMTGGVFVGHDDNDAHDYRLFFAGVTNGVIFIDVGSGTKGRGARETPLFSHGEWHRALTPIADSATSGHSEVDGQMDYVQDAISLSTSGFGVYARKLKFFAGSSTKDSQTGAVRMVRVRDFDTGRLLADFWPKVKSGVPGIYDRVAGKFYTSTKGTLRVVPWKELSTAEGWNP